MKEGRVVPMRAGVVCGEVTVRILVAVSLVAGVLASMGCGGSSGETSGEATPGGNPGEATSTEYTYQVPPRTGDGWDTSSLAEQGINRARLERMMGVIEDRVLPATEK
jgi:hypothetical protein